MSKVNAGILGTGHSYPKGVLTNADLEKIVDTSDEWITTRTGIKQRRKAAPDEYTSQFAVRASREAIDIVAACSGFLYGLSMANAMIRGGQTKYALVIGAEILTRYVDYTDRSTCVLFGDGAGVAVLG